MYEIIAAQGKHANQSYDSYIGRYRPFGETLQHKMTINK